MGNQLFQLAAASLMSSKFRQPVIPYTEGLQRYKTVRKPDSLKLISSTDWLIHRDMGSSNLLKNLSVHVRIGRLIPVFGVNDRNYWRMINGSDLNTPFFMDGYFQSGWTSKTFANALSTISIADICEIAKNRIDADEVVIHIRGGDFLKIEKFQIVDADFYICAIKRALNQGWKRYAIIADDLDYANNIRNRIADKLVDLSIRILPSGSDDFEDFDTIRGASARIIGNSTFAWWAAALAKNTTPTWSTSMWSIDKRKDFCLRYEIPLEILQN